MITEPEPAEAYPVTLHHPFTIADIRVENYRTRTFVFKEDLPCQPGQFVMAWLPRVDEKPFSIAGEKPLALTIVAVGPFSEAKFVGTRWYVEAATIYPAFWPAIQHNVIWLLVLFFIATPIGLLFAVLLWRANKGT